MILLYHNNQKAYIRKITVANDTDMRRDKAKAEDAADTEQIDDAV